MSSNIDNEEHDPVANLHMHPTKGILKSSKSTDDAGQDVISEVNNCSTTTGMTRSESKSHKIPHFDEMNIIATYHPVDKDYGHMKIEEPKTPYARNEMIDEELNSEQTTMTGIDPNALAQRLNESSVPSPPASRMRTDRLARRSIDEDIEPSSDDSEHRKQFENHRKQHYNEFEIVRLRKKEIEDELRALEQDETSNQSDGKGIDTISSSRSSVESIKPILIHPESKDSSSSSGHHQHHVHVEDDQHDDQQLTPEERERKKQFELKRKKHYNEFRAARLADKDDDEQETTG
jgi:protein phosphatase inhibitor 2